MLAFIGKITASIVLVVCCFLSPLTAFVAINTIGNLWDDGEND